MAVLRDYLDATLKWKLDNADDVISNYFPEFNDSTKRTAAEVSAGVTPVNYAYAPGDVRRYGAVGDDSTDCTAAFQAAIDQADESNGSEVFIPQGTWLVTSALTGARGIKLIGEGRYRSIVRRTGSGNFLTFIGSVGNADGGSMVFRDFTIKGTSSAGNLIELETAGQVEFTGMRFWLTGASFVVMTDNTHRVAFDNCLFQSWATAAIFTDDLCSILTVTNCQFNIVGGDSITQNASSACISLGDG
jgi:hypothetical protein